MIFVLRHFWSREKSYELVIVFVIQGLLHLRTGLNKWQLIIGTSFVYPSFHIFQDALMKNSRSSRPLFGLWADISLNPVPRVLLHPSAGGIGLKMLLNYETIFYHNFPLCYTGHGGKNPSELWKKGWAEWAVAQAHWSSIMNVWQVFGCW